ncbi:trimeric intracellular cation channel family protein [Propionibacteriaceae bacterium Y1923]|uniref:trimeric intracellular cation channel family protein n=1 Tax=Aestuariimicrobium sp. Y1814 TaxID=3418742 RepID=UPI003C1A17CE
MLLTVLYVIGITAEAMTGALAAGREKMDLFGVIIIATVTAIGGGSLRDMLLGHYPLTWVRQPLYLVLVVVAAVLTVSIASLMRYFRSLFLALDAVGLVVFSILGAKIAREMELGLVIACVAAITTGVFGGVMRDLLCNRVPLVFRKELYASVSLAATLLYIGLHAVGLPDLPAVVITLVAGFTMRMLAVHHRLSLPVFDYQEVENKPIAARPPHPWSRRFSSNSDD